MAEVRKRLRGDAEAGSFLQQGGSTESSAAPFIVSQRLGERTLPHRELGGARQHGCGYQAEGLVLSRPMALKFLPGG